MRAQKVQLQGSDLEFIEASCKLLGFKSKSDYMRTAIRERIQADRRKLRELKRRQAMAAYGGDVEAVFEPIEAEEFEER